MSEDKDDNWSCVGWGCLGLIIIVLVVVPVLKNVWEVLGPWLKHGTWGQFETLGEYLNKEHSEWYIIRKLMRLPSCVAHLVFGGVLCLIIWGSGSQNGEDSSQANT